MLAEADFFLAGLLNAAVDILVAIFYFRDLAGALDF
jgi:hypothetical protein